MYRQYSSRYWLWNNDSRQSLSLVSHSSECLRVAESVSTQCWARTVTIYAALPSFTVARGTGSSGVFLPPFNGKIPSIQPGCLITTAPNFPFSASPCPSSPARLRAVVPSTAWLATFDPDATISSVYVTRVVRCDLVDPSIKHLAIVSIFYTYLDYCAVTKLQNSLTISSIRLCLLVD